MSFDPNANLDPSQVQDRRGQRVTRGAGIAIGGGGIGLVVLLLSLLLGINPFEGGTAPAGYGELADQQIDEQGPASSSLAERCRTGADANRYEDCRLVGYVNSIQAYWKAEFATRGAQYPQAPTRFFSEATRSECGFASAEMGPFYCPLDRVVFIDLGFFDDLQTRFGASGGRFAQAYVLAHEYGHHIQNLTGVLESGAGDRDTGPQSRAVRVELQADCLAGLWAHHATSTGYISQLTERDIADALDAAAAVGDDRIQQQVQGQVTPERWTHGSAQQRQRWFGVGYQSGQLEQCDTFQGRV
jgi:predicted metalloprotease